jgi:hypothetical protein
MSFEVFWFDIKPHRIQRKRIKGWRMPPNTVYVGRPTRWGNYEASLRLYDIQARYQNEVNPRWLDPLRGKNLACWCGPDQPCHADILLELANKGA